MKTYKIELIGTEDVKDCQIEIELSDLVYRKLNEIADLLDKQSDEWSAALVITPLDK